MSQFFNVVFAGEIVAGADAAAVRANVGRLFRVDDAMLARLFSGQRVALKKNVDQAVAMKMRAAMKQAGAIVHLVAVESAAVPDGPVSAVASPASMPTAPATVAAAPLAAVAAPKPAAPAVATAPASSAPMTMAQRIAALNAQQDAADAAAREVSVAALTVADGAAMTMLPTGARLSDESREPAPAAPDVSGISIVRPGGDLVREDERELLRPAPVSLPDLTAIELTPAGGDLLKPEERPISVPVVVDVSALSVAPPESEILKPDERPVVVPVEVDISALSMAQPGAPLDEIREHRAPVNPDTSHLKLA